jgi:hypothetical protein
VSQAASYENKSGINIVPYPKLFEYILDMRLNGFFADEKLFPNIQIYIAL